METSSSFLHITVLSCCLFTCGLHLCFHRSNDEVFPEQMWLCDIISIFGPCQTVSEPLSSVCTLETFSVFTGDVTHCLEEWAVYVNREVQLKIKMATDCTYPYVSKTDDCTDKGSEKREARQAGVGEQLILKNKKKIKAQQWESITGDEAAYTGLPMGAAQMEANAFCIQRHKMLLIAAEAFMLTRGCSTHRYTDTNTHTYSCLFIPTDSNQTLWFIIAVQKRPGK